MTRGPIRHLASGSGPGTLLEITPETVGWRYVSSSVVALAAGEEHRADSGPNEGEGMRRFDAASYADAMLSRISSLPGSVRNTSENGKPGAGRVVGTSEATAI